MWASETVWIFWKKKKERILAPAGNGTPVFEPIT
jgi:hypothetical protein